VERAVTRDDDDNNKIIIIIIIINSVFCVCSFLIWFAGTKHRGQLQAPAALPPAEGVAGTN
jgi:hypothetical protein